MKKHLCMAVAACGLLSLASCSDDENVIMNDQPVVETGEQVITLNVQSTDVLSTKSRPLYSTENKGAEEVTDVALLIFEMAESNEGYPMTLNQVIPISRWDQVSSPYRYGHEYTIHLGENGTTKLANGKSYTIIAVGQNEAETIIPAYEIVVGASSSSLIADLALTSWPNTQDKVWNASTNQGDGFLVTKAFTQGEEPIRYGEIFSGTSKPVVLDGDFDGGFTAEVLLKRQVAGVIGYFNQIPSYVDMDVNNGGKLATKKIRLVASAKNTQIDLAHVLGDQTDDATDTEITEAEAVVNGFAPAKTKDAKFEDAADNNAYIVYEIDLKDWFTTSATGGDSPSDYWGTTLPTEANEDGTYDIPSLGDEESGATWKNGIDGSNNHPRVAPNAVLAGEFIIPFNKAEDLGLNTFELQLIGTNNGDEVILKKWNVKLDESSLVPEKDTESIYNIYRNHLYQIGQRGGGDDPSDPGNDPDEPQPLDKNQDLKIKINDNWEIIHDMVID